MVALVANVGAEEAGDPVGPESPAVAAWWSAVQSAEAGQLRALVAHWFAPGLVTSPEEREAHLQRLRAVAQNHSSARLHTVEEGPDSASLLLQSDGDWVRFTFRLDGSEPALISAIEARFVAPPSPEPPPRTVSLESFRRELTDRLDRASAEGGFSGAVLVVRDGEEVFSGAWGLASLRYGVANSLDTRFNLGSAQKLLTAVGVLRLVAAGRLSLDDTVGGLLPDYPNPAVRAVTVRQLLSHRAGLGTHFTAEFREKRRDLYRDWKDYLPLFQAEEPAFAPGSKFRYSNAGYFVLGLLIEKVAGDSWEDHLDKSLFEPLAMGRTGAFDVDGPAKDLATGYYRETIEAGGNRRELWLSNAGLVSVRGTPAGGTYSTVGDLARFAAALVRGELLPEDLRRQMVEPISKVSRGSASYGLGVVVRSLEDGGVSWGHSGGYPGVSADLRIYPTGSSEHWDVVAVLANFDQTATPVAQEIEALLPERSARSVPPPREAAAPDDSKAEQGEADHQDQDGSGS